MMILPCFFLFFLFFFGGGRGGGGKRGVGLGSISTDHLVIRDWNQSIQTS